MKTIEQQLISVIMPCYNAASYVEEAVTSVLRQTYPNTEVIVVDDGSSDGSSDIVKKLVEAHPGRVNLKHQNHSGPYPARNIGLHYARGGYVAFLDADDYWREDCLEKLHQALLATRTDVVYCGWQNFGASSASNDPYIPPKYEDGDLVAAFLKSCPWPIHAALVRQPVIHAVRGFSERLSTSMDYDLWLRIMAHTQKIVRVPEVMAFYRWHGQQISSNRSKQVLNSVQVRKDFVAQHPHLVRHLPQDELQELTDGYLLRQAYRSYWNRELSTASELFRQALQRGIWRLPDLRYILPSLLPTRILGFLVGMMDQYRGDTRA